MGTIKRATATLAESGLPDLEIRRGRYGYTVWHKTAMRQKSRTFKTSAEAVESALNGILPEILDVDTVEF